MLTTRHTIDGEARLSRLQKAILRAMWTETSRLGKVYKARGEHDLRAGLQYWLAWYPSQRNFVWTPTDRAVVSRALRRLEQRGLVERTNAWNDASSRTASVRLTERGRKIARRIRKSALDGLNRPFLSPWKHR